MTHLHNDELYRLPLHKSFWLTSPKLWHTNPRNYLLQIKIFSNLHRCKQNTVLEQKEKSRPHFTWMEINEPADSSWHLTLDSWHLANAHFSASTQWFSDDLGPTLRPFAYDRSPVEGLGFLLIFFFCSVGREPHCEIWKSKVIVSWLAK